MNQARTKPSDPSYSGGEDENVGNDKPQPTPHSQQSPPVDESDDGPATAPDDIGEG